MSNIPDNLKYTKDHEWVSIDGDTATIGITDHAQEALGDLVYVELPEVGRNVTKGEEFIVVESCKAASDVYAPIAGEIIEANDNLNDTPETINTSAYEGGWLVKMKISNAAELEELLDAASYKEVADE